MELKTVNELMAGKHMHINESGLSPAIIHHPAETITTPSPAHTSDFIPRESVSRFGDVDDVELIQDVEDCREEHEALSLADMEKQMIIRTLEKYRGRRKPAAEELKISERTLYRKIKEYKIDI